MSNGTSRSGDFRQDRRRRNSLLVMLAIGTIVFGAASAGLYYVLRPATLTIAVGPPGSDDDKVVGAIAQAFIGESRSIRLSPISTDGADASLALIAGGKADL